MKGIAHVASGWRVASFVPGGEQAAQGSLLVALDGACAMLPDALDFRFAKSVERRDADLIPDRACPDPQALAEAFALARVTPDRPRTVQFHPLRLGVVDWVTYALRFDVAAGDVVVTMGDKEGCAHVGSALPNVVTVWLALTLLLLNLDTGPFLGFAVLLPTVAWIAVYARRKMAGRRGIVAGRAQPRRDRGRRRRRGLS